MRHVTLLKTTLHSIISEHKVRDKISERDEKSIEDKVADVLK